MTRKNMKIEINAEQPLDEVVKELERLGYKQIHKSNKPRCAITSFKRGYGIYENCFIKVDATTLKQLREMK